MNTLLITLLLAVASVAPKQITADFRMVKTSPMLQGEQVSVGKMTYRSPDYIRWEYTSPEKTVWLMDGDKGNIPQQARRMVKMIFACVEGNGSVRDFKITTSGNVVTIVPERRDIRRAIEKIVVVRDGKTGAASTIEIFEANGGKSKITFTNVKQQ